MAEIVEQDIGLQTLLEPEQYETLKDMAQQEKRTLAEVLRETVRLGLESYEKEDARWRETLARLNQRRQEYHRIHGYYPGNPVAEVRAEREKQIDRVLRGEP